MKKYEVGILILVFTASVAWGMVPPSYGQEKAKQEGTPEEVAGFTIARLVVGTGVENHEPVGVAESFPDSTERVYCFLEATHVTKDTDVSFIWFHQEKEMRKIILPLKMGPRWRTYTFKNLGELKGEWKVEIKDAKGNFLKDVKFKVE